jgi:hypothetical protein
MHDARNLAAPGDLLDISTLRQMLISPSCCGTVEVGT